MTKTVTAAMLAALALSLSACGGNDDAEASKSISGQIMKSQKSSSSSSQFLSLKKKDADCIGDGFVDKIGVDKLRKYKIINDENKAQNNLTNVKMSNGDAESATEVLIDCTDVAGMVKKAISSAGTIPKETQSCINDELTEKALRPVFVEVFKGDPSAAQKGLTAPLQKCLTGNQG